MNLPTAYSLYWNNIHKDIITAQSKVFSALNIPLQQELQDKVPHGRWLQEKTDAAGIEEILVFVDIDAFPLSRQAYINIVQQARDGAIVGLAQAANHLESKSEIYAGPMMLAFSKHTYYKLGRPNLMATKNSDSGQSLTINALKYGVDVKLIFPNCCLVPKWALGSYGIFGIGTFYGSNDFFHLGS